LQNAAANRNTHGSLLIKEIAVPVPILYESHMHTTLCRHARGTPDEYAAVALQKNLKGITITCHNPMPDGYSQNVRMYLHEWPTYLALVEQARKDWSGKVDVLLGIECDFAPGFEAYLETQLKAADFHHVLGSVHPQVSEYRKKFHTGDSLAYQKLYFEHLAQAAESKLFDTISHPDLVKNIHPSEWQLERLLDDVRRSLDRIASTGVAMELNTSGRMKDIPEYNPGPQILQEIALRKIPVVLGADAHDPHRVADHYPEALRLLAQTGHTHVHIHHARKRIPIKIEDALQSLT
jgi:histidinol-phosphatase (PHP family)